MLDLKYIINNFENVKKRLSTRKFELSNLDKILSLSKKRSEVITQLQSLEAERNSISKEIGLSKSKGLDFEKLSEQVLEIKDKISNLKVEEEIVENDIQSILLLIPNIPHVSVPIGESEEDNIEIAEHGNIGRGLIEGVKPHFDVGVDLDIVDFERAVKISGTRFWSYKKEGARLERALENFMLDIHIKRGYIEYRPPVLVNSASLKGTGQLPKFKEDLFKIEELDLWLIPTAEVPLTNLYAGEIIDLKKPMKFTAFTPCFRSEAGSGGRDTRGLIRGKQFNKVEIVKLVTHNQLEEEYYGAIEDAKNILELLELPYREVLLSTGDLGFSSEKTVDLEVWIPSEKKYREISSISTFNDFQGRRASIRYKNEEGKNIPVCTINGSGLAIDRTIAAILENYQNEDGSISIPKALLPYMSGIEKITRN